MGVRMTGLASGIDPKLVEKLIDLEKVPVENAKKRKESKVSEKKEFEKLQTQVNELETAVNGLRTKGDFYKLKVESSHPDILDGIVSSGNAVLGTYEFEVRGLAKSEKELAYGFPDKDQTPVGFGYMYIEREDMDGIEITIDPDATLQDVANKINDSGAGVRAMVVNTKYKPDGYRLLVVSEKSGEEAKVYVDPDTTFLEFKEQVTGRNLDVLFEDVPVTDVKNSLDELLEGVVFNAKRSEPGTKVEVSVTYDVDKTMEGIKSFVEKYNQIAQFVHDQIKINPDNKRADGLLAGDSSIRTALRQLQSTLIDPANFSGKYNNLADIGITTDPKTGILKMDETKVKAALAEDYDGVARLFIRSNRGTGVAEKMAAALRGLKDPAAGILKTRLKGFESIIKNQDQEIERKERQMEERQESVKRRFMNMENKIAGMQSQGNFLAQRFAGAGGGSAPQGGGAPGG